MISFLRCKFVSFVFLCVLFTFSALRFQTPVASPNRSNQNRSIPIIQTTFNGIWWASVSKEQQLGFVSGYYDCYKYDMRQQIKSNASYEEWQEAVSHYYAKSRDNLGSLLPSVLRRVFRTHKRKAPFIKGGEVWREPHGFFDGLWWIGAAEKERIGFVEGYVWCRSKEAKKQPAKFSGSAEQYAGRLNKYFDDPNNEEQKVAHALYHFRDR